MTKTDNQTQTMAKADIEAVRERLAHVSYLWRRIGEDQRADDMDAILAAQAAHAAQRDALRDALEAITGTTDWFYTVSMPRALRDKAEEALSALPERWERVSPGEEWVPVGTVVVERADIDRWEAEGRPKRLIVPAEGESNMHAITIGNETLVGDYVTIYLRSAAPSAPEVPVKATFQERVQPWMLACFGAEIAADRLERNDRFIEEALELTQASGYTADRAHQLVDYVFGRPDGEINQEVGGVMVTLAAHCLAHGVDMHAAAETELARVWTKVDQIREKQKTKPKGSALPIPVAPTNTEGA